MKIIRKRAGFALCIVFSLIGALSWTSGKCQLSENIVSMEPDTSFDNILVKKIASDSLSGSFVIWVSDKVKEHYHATHTENIYIIAGEGTMTLNGKSVVLKPGDFINIPSNTRHSLKVNSVIPVKVLSVQSPGFYGKDRIFTEE